MALQKKNSLAKKRASQKKGPCKNKSLQEIQSLAKKFLVKKRPRTKTHVKKGLAKKKTLHFF